MKNKIINTIVNKLTEFLLYLVDKLNTPKQHIQSVNKQDMELITKSFPVFVPKNDMTIEQIALGFTKSQGEQRVIQYLYSRIKGRIGQGVAYD